MKKKKNILRTIAILLAVVLITTGAGIENVSAFWNQDGMNKKDGEDRTKAVVVVRLMHCNHSDVNDTEYSSHYDNNGNHLNITSGDKIVKYFNVTPRVNDDIAAGTATYDLNKYVYEYEMSYSEGQQVDYAVITTPNITHFEDPSAKGVTETHGRMYWLGEYQNTMENITATTGANEWYSFKEQTGAEVNNELSHQTWESVEAGNDGAYKGEYVVSLDVSNTIDNGQKFLYLLEGTYVDKDIHDSNHPAKQDEGVPAYYGTHVYGIIGIVFYRTVSFDANGGLMQEGSVRDMQVYSGSSKGKLYTWYNDRSKRKWYSGIDVSSPQVTTPYGTASVKAPSRADYIFTGWYDTPDGGVLIYDTDGNAVKGTKYFDSNGCWIYKGNVTAYANWEFVGNYTVRYDKGASDSFIPVPADQHVTVGNSAVLSETNLIGSSYEAYFERYTNNTGSGASAVDTVSGYFAFDGWLTGTDSAIHAAGSELAGSSSFAKNTVVSATAHYADYSFALPDVTGPHYTFEGWYDSYDEDTQTFGNLVGKAGDMYTLRASADAQSVTLYARWSKAGSTVSFDYNIPKAAKNSRLGYTLTGDGETGRTVYLNTPLGTLPSPSLTGYRLMLNETGDGWSRTPNDNRGNQIYSPVRADTLYDASYTTLYAQWEPVYYDIHYELDGGSVSGNPSSANYYDELTIKNPAKTGSRFTGWAISGMDDSTHVIDGTETADGTAETTADGGSSVNVLGLRADPGTVTFTALWEDEIYTLGYQYRRESDMGLLTPEPDAVAEAGNPVSYTRSTPEFTLRAPYIKGYYFTSWSTTGLSGRVPTVTITQGSTGNRSSTAYYSATGYNIVYNLNGGAWASGASHPDTAYYDTAFTVSSPVLNGCTFEGWTITRMCGDCSHTIGSSSAVSEETEASGITGTLFKNLRCDGSVPVVFTAVWSKVPYTIKYDFNGGSPADGGAYPETVSAYTSFEISNPVCPGKTFLGWTITGMDSGTHYIPGMADTTSERLTGVGTGVANGMALTYGNLRYSTGTVSFTAVWGDKDRTVLFFGNGGTMSGSNVQDDWTMRFIKFGSAGFFSKYAYDTDWGTDVPQVTKTGYAFAGYYDSLTDGNEAFAADYGKTAGLYWAPDGTWTGPSLILYARFVPKNYTVRFDANGGRWISGNTDETVKLTVIYDSSQNNKAYGRTDVYRPGYTFGGWTTERDGTGYMIYDADGYNTAEGGYWSEDYRKDD